MTRTWHARLVALALLAAGLCPAADRPAHSAQLSRLVKALDIQPQPSTSRDPPQFCRRILIELTSEDSKTLVPSIELASYDKPALARFLGKCAHVDLGEWYSPEGLPYHATRTFRVFELPKGVENLEREGHFVLFAQSYFNSFVKGQFASNPKIHEFAGFAWADGSGGGAIYTVVDRSNCTIDSQLVVHGEYNHMLKLSNGIEN